MASEIFISGKINTAIAPATSSNSIVHAVAGDGTTTPIAELVRAGLLTESQSGELIAMASLSNCRKEIAGAE